MIAACLLSGGWSRKTGSGSSSSSDGSALGSVDCVPQQHRDGHGSHTSWHLPSPLQTQTQIQRGEVNTTWCEMVRYGTVRYGTVRYGTVRYGTVRYGTVRYGAVQCSATWQGVS